MGASFLCICPPKSIRFDDSKDTSQAEISARLDSVSCFRGQPAGQLCLPGAGAVYSPALELSVATEGSCFAVFKGYALRLPLSRLLDHSKSYPDVRVLLFPQPARQLSIPCPEVLL